MCYNDTQLQYVKNILLNIYKMKMNLKKLNQSGFDHVIGAVTCFVVVGLVGTALVVQSHAYTSVFKGVLEAGSASSGYCLSSAAPATGSKVILNPCKSGVAYQTWSRNDIRSATVFGVKNVEEFTLQSSSGTTECLNDPYGSKTNGTQAQVYTCSSSSTAGLWVWGGSLTGKGLSSRQIVNVASGLCIDDSYGAHTANNKVQLWACKTSAQTNQSWFEVASASGVSTSGSKLPSLPLETNGRFIVSRSNTNSRVKLDGINWFGAEESNYAPAGLNVQPLSLIVANYKKLGINSVRLLWSTDTWNENPLVPNSALTANPSLEGLHSRDVMDKVVNALASQGIMVILDNHTSNANWCCSGTDGDELWWEDYNPSSPPNWSAMSAAQKNQLYEQGNTNWLDAWRNIITRYGPKGSDPQPTVIGADLRNEPRADTTLGLSAIWGGPSTPVYENWQQAATTAGDAVLSINPNMLLMVEGVNYSAEFGGSLDPTDLPVNPANGNNGVKGYPIKLSVAHHVVYSPHNYSWFTQTSDTVLNQWWGFLLANSSYQAPVWMGEFGTCNTSATSCITTTSQGVWWQLMTQYLMANDVDWSYWAGNGTLIDGQTAEGYGLLNPTWNGPALPALTKSLQGIESKTKQP